VSSIHYIGETDVDFSFDDFSTFNFFSLFKTINNMLGYKRGKKFQQILYFIVG
jgi:hypothetical protein